MEVTADYHIQKEQDDRRTSAIVTTIVTLILLLMLFYPFFSFMEEDQEAGIMIALGNIDTESFGDEVGAAPTESSEESETSTNDTEESSASESEPIASAETSASAKKDVATADEKDSINLNKEKEDKKKADKKKAEDKKKAAADAKKKTEADKKRKAEEERKRKEKELADKKKELSDLLGGGDGNDAAASGDENGEPDKSNLEGITTGVGDIGGGLSGRDVVSRPTFTNNSQATGKVVVKVCVDSEGKIISSKFTQKGTTATDLSLIKTAENGVKKYKFSSGDLDKQCGTITVNFKLK